MRVAMFSVKNFERTLLDELNASHQHELVYFDVLLGAATASLAAGFPAVSVFVNDPVDADVLKRLAAGGTNLVATRSTGFSMICCRRARFSASSDARDRNNPVSSDQNNLQASHIGRLDHPIRRLWNRITFTIGTGMIVGRQLRVRTLV